MKGLLISDFNIENLASYLKKEPNAPAIESVSVCYGRVSQTLLDDAAPIWSERPDFVVAWTRPEGVLQTFGDLLSCSPVSDQDLNREVDSYAAALLRASKRTRAMLVPTWVIPPFHQTQGLMDLAASGGAALVEFHRELKALTRRGSLLAIGTKKEESVAIEASAKPREIGLKLHDFAGWRINWRDKAENIHGLMNQLNLRLDSAVFIGD